MRDQLGHLGRDCDELLEVVQEEERLLVADQRCDAFSQRPLPGQIPGFALASKSTIPPSPVRRMSKDA